MEKFEKSATISSRFKKLKNQGHTIGFVPTMGALHEGHMGLISRAKDENDFVVCSIFVNPLQFNRKEDLDSYPDRLLQDIEMLEKEGCDFLFTPTREDLYPNEPTLDYDFGSLGVGMEATYRPGHFAGVAAVIDRFLRVLEPTKAYFGEKDYQQLAIVKWLVENQNFTTEIVGCETIRYDSGLAMSSRNYNLKKGEFEIASNIYKWMNYVKTQKPNKSPLALTEEVKEALRADFEIDYVSIVDGSTMQEIESWDGVEEPRIFVAAYLGSVRLIDNISLL